MASRGTFNTPRTLGTVDEIHVDSIRLRRNDTGYDISGAISEGEDVAGRFVETLRKELRIQTDTLAAADQTVLEDFIQLLIREYVSQEGYIGVTISKI